MTCQRQRSRILKMASRKAAGLDKIMVEMIKALREFGVHWLTQVLRSVGEEKKISSEWRKSILVTIHKQKGDIHV